MGDYRVGFLLDGFGDDFGCHIEREEDTRDPARTAANLNADVVALPCRPSGGPGFKKLFNLRKDPSPEKMIALAESWRPYRSVASWYVWRTIEE